MYMSGYSQDKGRTIIQHYNNYGEPGYNMRIYKKNKEMFNIYSYD